MFPIEMECSLDRRFARPKMFFGLELGLGLRLDTELGLELG